MRLRNACGQAALARALLRLRLADEPLPALTRRVHARTPPDTPFALAGTTPWGLARACAAHGLRARRSWHLRARPARATLEGALARGEAALVCLDLRPLGHRWPMLHWVLVEQADEEGVLVDGLVQVPLPSRARLAWSPFLRAWACAWVPVPGYRHALVAAGRPDTP